MRAVGGVVERFDVDIRVPLAARLVGHDHDPGPLRPREHALKRSRRVGNDRDRVRMPCDQAPNDRHLTAWARVVGRRHSRLDAGPGGELPDAVGHAVEPREAAHFDDGDDSDARAPRGLMPGALRAPRRLRAHGDAEYERKGEDLEALRHVRTDHDPSGFLAHAWMTRAELISVIGSAAWA